MKYQICCDMDGVLCNFTKSAIDVMNNSIQNKDEFQNTDPELYDLIDRTEKEVGGFITPIHIGFDVEYKAARSLMKRLVTHDEDFWANLEWLDGGKEIWNKIKDHKPHILSAPMKHSKECKAGKRRWVEKNLKPLPNKIILDDNKGKHTKFGDKTGLLIDDRIDNIEDYRDNGGAAVWTESPKLQSVCNMIDLLIRS